MRPGAHGLPCGSQHALSSTTALAPAPHGLAGWQRGENAFYCFNYCQSLVVSLPAVTKPTTSSDTPAARPSPPGAWSVGRAIVPWLRQASSQAAPQATTTTASSHDPHVNPLALPLHVRRCVELNSNLGPSPLSQLSLRARGPALHHHNQPRLRLDLCLTFTSLGGWVGSHPRPAVPGR